MSTIHGRNVILQVEKADVEEQNWPSVALVKNMSISFTRDLIPTNTPTTAHDTEYVAGRESWTVSCSGLVAVDNSLFETLRSSRVPITVKTVIGNKTLKGKALVRSCNQSANIGSLAAYNLTLSISGTFC